MQLRGLLVCAALLMVGCSSSGPFNNPGTTPPKPTIPLRTEGWEPSRYKPGCSVTVPKDWVFDKGIGGANFNPPGQDGSGLFISDEAQKDEAEKARDALAEHNAIVERTVSGGVKSTKGSFQSLQGRPVYWVQYPSGGGGSSRVLTRYFLVADAGHYELLAECDPTKAGSDSAALTQACDYAAASAQFSKL